MTKFPAPRRLFSDVSLRPDESERLEQIAHKLVDDVVLESRVFRETCPDGVPDTQRWKRVRGRLGANLALYRELSSDPFRSRETLPAHLIVGRLGCSLDDALYGLSSVTADTQRLRSSYMQDGVLDSQNLHALRVATPTCPLEYLNLQWSIMAPPRRRRKSWRLPFLQPRDFVTLDGTGELVTSDSSSLVEPEAGRRVGYFLRHSVHVEAVASLKHLQVVRGVMSMCGIFRETSPGIVQVYLRVAFNPKSSALLNHQLATHAAVEQALALNRLPRCARMKKLVLAVRQHEARWKRVVHASGTTTLEEEEEEEEEEEGHGPEHGLGRVLRQRGASDRHHGRRPSSHRTRASSATLQAKPCRSCNKKQLEATAAPPTPGKRSCGLCEREVCRSCRVRCQLSFMGRYNRVLHHRLSFCRECVGVAIHRDAYDVAADELTERRQSGSVGGSSTFSAHSSSLGLSTTRSRVACSVASSSSSSDSMHYYGRRTHDSVEPPETSAASCAELLWRTRRYSLVSAPSEPGSPNSFRSSWYSSASAPPAAVRIVSYVSM